MQSAWSKNSFKHWRMIITYILIAGLIALGGVLPVQADSSAAGSSFSSFTVTTDTPAYFSGYMDNQGGYSKETPVYHFKFTAADPVQAGDIIQVELPYQYNFEGNPSLFIWTANQAIPTANMAVMVNGISRSIVDTAATQYSENGKPALQFKMSGGIVSGDSVDIRLMNFLITPDYHYMRPGPQEYAISTDKNATPLPTTHNLFTNNVADYYPDADSYAAAAVTGYHFKFTVMQPIDPSSSITIVFPQESTRPAVADASKIKINGMAASSAVWSGNELTVQTSIALPSFSTVQIDMDSAAQVTNPSVPGYYNYDIKTSVDPKPASRKIGIMPSSGGSLADNPSHNGGYVSSNGNQLRFMFAAPTILKAGDTVTVSSAPGTILSDPSIAAGDIKLEWSAPYQEQNEASPSSVTRLADNKLQFVLPAEYYCDPDYHLVFNLPNVIAQSYGEYEFQVTTSQQRIPASVTLLVTPLQIQNLKLNVSSTVADTPNVSYSFAFETNEPLEEGDAFQIVIPRGMTVPEGIQARDVSVNGVQADSVSYDRFLRKLSVGVPMNLHLMDPVTITIAGSAGLTNPAIGEYSFSVYPMWYDWEAAVVKISFTEAPTMTGITISPNTVDLKLGERVNKQLQVTANFSDQSVKDITASSAGTTYSSSDTNVAIVSADGLIEAKQAGQAVITVTSSGYTHAVNVKVAKADAPPPATVTGITASPKVVELKLGSNVSQQLQVTASLSDQTARDVTAADTGTTYSSSDTNVATVQSNGLIEAKQSGQAVITVTNSVYTDKVNVTVTKADTPTPNITMTGIAVSPKVVELKLGSNVSRQLQVTASLSDQTTKDVTAASTGTTYSSSDTNVATVQSNGLVEAKQSGQAVITVTNSVYTDKVNVTIVKADTPAPNITMTGIAVTPKVVELKLGSNVSKQLQVTASLSDQTTKDVTAASTGTTYSSSDANIATVQSNGLIEAKQSGQAVITVTNSVYSEKVNVTVAAADQQGGGSSTTRRHHSSLPLQDPDSVEKDIIAAEGGIVDLKGIAYVQIPPAALPADGKIKAAKLPADQAAGMERYSPTVEFSSSTGKTFKLPVTLGFAYQAQQAAAGLKPAVYYYNESQARWVYLGGNWKDNGTITVEVTHFGKFAVFASESVQFQDLNGHWVGGYADRLVGMKVIRGFEDHTFRPDQNVTRAEFVKMIAELMGLPSTAASTAFADNESIPNWARGAVASAVQAGIISGYEEKGKLWFKSNQPITRAEMAVIFNRVLERHLTTTNTDKVVFSDQASIPSWAQSAVTAIAGHKLVSGYQDGSFRPDQSATRAETVKMLYMLSDLLPM
ncbi:S-layer homology domain-containing protein [Paenibacillus sp. 32352]|uniref:S-layer homology domain-containing protein n=1 Tax=Paenibacillus sp. 32352 TaxID=1969111 RepID=UPI0009AEA0A1|nr:S-layer homology domain-containing protein [Paenibacillus sp. 32352]